MAKRWNNVSLEMLWKSTRLFTNFFVVILANNCFYITGLRLTEIYRLAKVYNNYGCKFAAVRDNLRP
jgi:hypothetical protein